MFRIKIKFENGEERALVLDGKQPIVIGRAEGVDVTLADKHVSRRHAQLLESGGNVYIEDLGSRTGTRRNGVPIVGREQLTTEDVVEIGLTQLRLEALLPEEKPSVAVPAPQTPQSPMPPLGAHNLPVYTADGSSEALYSDTMIELSRRVQNRVLELLNLNNSSVKEMTSKEIRPRVEEALDRILREIRHEIPADAEIAQFRQILLDNLIGLGPLSPLLRDATISEIMINGPNNIFIESKGKLYRTATKFNSESHLQSIIQRIVEPLGRHIDAASPMVDARLEDGSRVNAVIPPLALDGSLVTIRKFPAKKLTDEDLIKFGSLTKNMALFLREAVRARRNILVSGGTGSGKTTLLNILSQFIPEKERIITVEDSAELKLTHENLCRLEARPANVEGQGRVTIRDLVINTLRMRPDRIIVGECRGAEALDMLQAMNTGHDGSMTTCHANNPRDALSRLENMVMMAGFELPSSAIREQIASAINLIVQQTRLPDGSRKIVKISEVTGREGSTILLQDIFTFEQEGFDEKFHVIGHHTATGNIPHFIDELRQSGDLELDMSVFVPEG